MNHLSAWNKFAYIDFNTSKKICTTCIPRFMLQLKTNNYKKLQQVVKMLSKKYGYSVEFKKIKAQRFTNLTNFLKFSLREDTNFTPFKTTISCRMYNNGFVKFYFNHFMLDGLQMANFIIKLRQYIQFKDILKDFQFKYKIQNYKYTIKKIQPPKYKYLDIVYFLLKSGIINTNIKWGQMVKSLNPKLQLSISKLFLSMNYDSFVKHNKAIIKHDKYYPNGFMTVLYVLPQYAVTFLYKLATLTNIDYLLVKFVIGEGLISSLLMEQDFFIVFSVIHKKQKKGIVLLNSNTITITEKLK